MLLIAKNINTFIFVAIKKFCTTLALTLKINLFTLFYGKASETENGDYDVTEKSPPSDAQEEGEVPSSSLPDLLTNSSNRENPQVEAAHSDVTSQSKATSRGKVDEIMELIDAMTSQKAGGSGSDVSAFMIKYRGGMTSV